jgi:hypothetical protein
LESFSARNEQWPTPAKNANLVGMHANFRFGKTFKPSPSQVQKQKGSIYRQKEEGRNVKDQRILLTTEDLTIALKDVRISGLFFNGINHVFNWHSMVSHSALHKIDNWH